MALTQMALRYQHTAGYLLLYIVRASGEKAGVFSPGFLWTEQGERETGRSRSICRKIPHWITVEFAETHHEKEEGEKKGNKYLVSNTYDEGDMT